ncbi:hypothetical protein [Rhizorhapis sp. SPR117]|uniref:hypothetical protein n=1 Tax=Rhizorhapis sp. SPR117 TaxID=2912611 RepID=UPI001F24C177|nr:hypothetical protein [Rhizorhapis sp. SPR117]
MKLRAYIQMLALFLAGCAGSGSGSYPSLAKRPVESGNGASVSAPVSEPVTVDPALTREVGGLMDKARSGAAAFDAHVQSAKQQVAAAKGSAVSSEAWVTAQVAISDLESERYDSVFALASLDTLYINRLNAVTANAAHSSNTEIVDQARGDALAIIDRQNDILDGLKARLVNP